MVNSARLSSTRSLNEFNRARAAGLLHDGIGADDFVRGDRGDVQIPNGADDFQAAALSAGFPPAFQVLNGRPQWVENPPIRQFSDIEPDLPHVALKFWVAAHARGGQDGFGIDVIRLGVSPAAAFHAGEMMDDALVKPTGPRPVEGIEAFPVNLPVSFLRDGF